MSWGLLVIVALGVTAYTICILIAFGWLCAQTDDQDQTP